MIDQRRDLCDNKSRTMEKKGATNPRTLPKFYSLHAAFKLKKVASKLIVSGLFIGKTRILIFSLVSFKSLTKSQH